MAASAQLSGMRPEETGSRVKAYCIGWLIPFEVEVRTFLPAHGGQIKAPMINYQSFRDNVCMIYTIDTVEDLDFLDRDLSGTRPHCMTYLSQ